MDGSRQPIARGVNGRFLPGCSGNPAGKRPGTRNRATLLREVMREGDGHAMARHVVERAVGGDAVAARFCLDRLEPKRRGRPISLDLPEGASANAAVAAAFDSALRQLAAGEITPAEAVEISRFLESRVRALRAWARGQTTTEDPPAADASSPAGNRVGWKSQAPSTTLPPTRREKMAEDAALFRPTSNSPSLNPTRKAIERLSADGPTVLSAERKLAPPASDLPPIHLHSACFSRATAKPHGVHQALLGTASHRGFESDLARGP